MFKLLIVIINIMQRGALKIFRGYTPTAALGVASTYADDRDTPRVAVGVCVTP
jgi:hypothetical protein